MLSLLLLILTITVSAIVIRFGAVALELTGLKEEQAYFQALSAFSGVGYTTREAEFIINHPERRKIIRTLIWLGSAGVITSIATLAGTVISGKALVKSLTRDSYFHWAPLNPAQLTLALVVLFFLFLYLFLRQPAVQRLLKEVIAVFLVKGEIVRGVDFEELAGNSLGYQLVRLSVVPDSPLVDRRVEDLKFSENEIQVLSVERAAESVVHPPAGFKFRLDDLVICFGPRAAIQDLCGLAGQSESAPVADEELLRVGDLAPDFELRDQHGQLFQLSEHLKRSVVVLFFYPKDHSHTCSQMFIDYSAKANELKAAGIEVVGINPATPESHRSFCEATSASITVLSDSDKTVARAFGALALGGFLIDRSVYVVDRDGRILFAERGHPAVTKVLAAATAKGKNNGMDLPA